MALATTGIAWVSEIALVTQAGLGEWYKWATLILGLIFYIMLTLFPYKKLRV